ncbi:hypothetical protein [Corynebacterium phocae]|uniref:hypothetical protein n=1 Tax=Corynebacterium phocae TaxID=161895 RepID=UPI0012386A00|nr:hypothetical protein [Corynebacterium phocae]KAA8721562.1 hypothetical protein F4V58_09935 [Corynebacterium phocae]
MFKKMKKSLIALAALAVTTAPVPATANPVDQLSSTAQMSSNSLISEVSKFIPTIRVSSAPAPQTGNVVLHQGDRINFPGQGTCTVGWIDHSTRRAYTARHCGRDGSTATTVSNQMVGVIRHSPLSHGKSINDYDVAYIELSPNVTPGENKFSGNLRPLNNDQIAPGDEVCAVGAHSRRVSCSRVINNREGNPFLVSAHQTVFGPGDSGGPAWVPGKGFVGIIHGGYQNIFGGDRRVQFFTIESTRALG